MKRFYTFFVICLALSCWFDVADAQTVRIPDTNLAAVIRHELGLGPNEPITRQQMQTLRNLDASSYAVWELTGEWSGNEIRDITGLEHATQLRNLHLWGNQIRDIRSLTNLTRLTLLDLDDNQVQDIRPLTKLTRLTELFLGGNLIQDFRPLAGLQRLQRLGVSVSSIGVLRRYVDLTQLNALYLYGSAGGRITDFQLLAGLTQLTDLTIIEAQVSDLRFLKDLTGLESLNLYGNNIRDLKPLTNLTALKYLYLSDNEISDLKPLAGLTQLSNLYLLNNEIRDVSPLAGLSNLRYLGLDGNLIQDASPLAGLPNLEDVDIPLPPPTPTISISRADDTSDIHRVGEAVEYLIRIQLAQNVTGFNLVCHTPRKLTSIEYIFGSQGVDATSRKAAGTGTFKVSGLETGDRIRSVGGLALNATAAGTGELRVTGSLTTTQGRVSVNSRFPLELFPESGGDACEQKLTDPSVDACGTWVNLDSSNLKRLPNLKSTGGGSETTIVFVNLTGVKLNYYWINYEGNEQFFGEIAANALGTQSTYAGHVWLVKDRNEKNLAVFSAVEKTGRAIIGTTPISPGVPGNSGVISDPNLAVVIRDTLGLAPGKPITKQALKKLTALEASPYHIWELTGQEGTIADLTGLEHATKLRRVSLQDNQIQDIAPLATLTQLETVWLPNNPVRDLSPLANLEKLKQVSVNVNKIGTLRKYVDLTQLEALGIHGSGKSIQGLNLLAKLQQLRSLSVVSGKVKNLGFLKGLKQLGDLSLDHNAISNLSPLAGLTQLTYLSLWDNKIANLKPLAKLTQLTYLDLDDNKIRNVTPLAKLTQLQILYIANNQIRNVKPLAKLTNLETLSLKGNPIQDLSPLQRLPNLEDVDVEVPGLVAAAPATVAIPNQTALLANYPNPFNPETWIPYQLSEDSPVSISIYDTTGKLVRTLSLGFQSAGFYNSQGRAAYWDGRNTVGERVASGVYFYQLQTDAISPMRKMVILK